MKNQVEYFRINCCFKDPYLLVTSDMYLYDMDQIYGPIDVMKEVVQNNFSFSNSNYFSSTWATKYQFTKSKRSLTVKCNWACRHIAIYQRLYSLKLNFILVTIMFSSVFLDLSMTKSLDHQISFLSATWYQFTDLHLIVTPRILYNIVYFIYPCLETIKSRL